MIDRILLAVIAVATAAIAAKLWTTPEPPSMALMLRLNELAERPGADTEEIEKLRAAALQRTPWVWIRNP